MGMQSERDTERQRKNSEKGRDELKRQKAGLVFLKMTFWEACLKR